jgi:hypothetical protein
MLAGGVKLAGSLESFAHRCDRLWFESSRRYGGADGHGYYLSHWHLPVAISTVGLRDVWLAVEKCQTIKAGGETTETICS